MMRDSLAIACGLKIGTLYMVEHGVITSTDGCNTSNLLYQKAWTYE